jgi:hypothetical protein
MCAVLTAVPHSPQLLAWLALTMFQLAIVIPVLATFGCPKSRGATAIHRLSGYGASVSMPCPVQNIIIALQSSAPRTWCHLPTAAWSIYGYLCTLAQLSIYRPSVCTALSAHPSQPSMPGCKHPPAPPPEYSIAPSPCPSLLPVFVWEPFRKL